MPGGVGGVAGEIRRPYPDCVVVAVPAHFLFKRLPAGFGDAGAVDSRGQTPSSF